MDPFARFGIKHLSASSLRLYRDQPGAWVCRYLLGVKDEGGPAMWRGRAVEAGIDRFLYGYEINMAAAEMCAEFERNAVGAADDRTEKERKEIHDYLAMAQCAIGMKGIPLTRQSRLKIELPGVSIPIIGYADWIWPDVGRDLKTTQRLPSSPSPAHVEQMAIYMEATRKPFELVYVTPKKWAIYPISERERIEAMGRVRRAALAVQHMLSKVESGADALRLFEPDYTSYEWSPELILAANKVYDGATA